jgi:hypothetical protein
MDQDDPVGVQFFAIEDAVGSEEIGRCVMLGAGDGTEQQEDQ